MIPKRQVDSRRRIVRDNDNSEMTLQLKNTCRKSPRTQIHCVVRQNLTNDQHEQNIKESTWINDWTNGTCLLHNPLGLSLSEPPPNPTCRIKEQKIYCNQWKMQKGFRTDAINIGKGKPGDQNELTRFQITRQGMLFQLMTRRPRWLQQPRARMVVKGLGWPKIQSNK